MTLNNKINSKSKCENLSFDKQKCEEKSFDKQKISSNKTLKKIKIRPELTQYHKFSSLKSLDASVERINLLKKELCVKSNKQLLEIANNNPELLLKKGSELFKKKGPRSIGINPTPYCNRKCTFCSSLQRNEINIKEDIEIKEPKLLKLLKDFQDMKGKGVVLVGGGEALLACSGNLNNIVPRFNLHYGINTNGVNLDKFNNEKFIKKLSWASISIIAHNKETYNKVGRLNKDNNQFNLLEKNLKELFKIVEETKSNSYISAKIMICRENYMYADKIYNYIKKLGFKDIALRCVNNFETIEIYRGHTLKMQDVELSLEEKKELYNLLSKKTDIKDKEIENITGIYQNLKKEYPSFQYRTKICWNIVLGLMCNIDTDGQVYLCNPHLGENNFEIGNINLKGFKEIWTSKKHIDIISKTYNNKSNCNLLKCRHDRVNELIDLYMHGFIGLKDRKKEDILMSYFP